jgi:hypothetical protein
MSPEKLNSNPPKRKEKGRHISAKKLEALRIMAAGLATGAMVANLSRPPVTDFYHEKSIFDFKNIPNVDDD